MARTKVASMPEVGDDAPNLHLPSAQGGQFKMSVRTPRGPVVVAFYRGTWAGKDVEYFKALAEREDEINMTSTSMVGVGVGSPDEARDFVKQSGIKSYVLYDYTKSATRDWGVLRKDNEHGEHACPAVFIVGPDHKVVHAWTEDRPDPEEILKKVNRITHLPKPPEEEDEDEQPEGDEAQADTETSEDSDDNGADSELEKSGADTSSEQDETDARPDQDEK
ncbi:hypothetical protein BH23ACT11_BH23ACT11_10890 [soil metagenome]